MTIGVEPGKYLEVEPGVELYYVDQGQGMPLVFVPGWTFTSEAFVHQVEHFSKTHRVIALDPRSHGRSSVAQDGNNYVRHGADLAALIQALELRDVVLVGWSFGCLTNWSFVQQEGLGALKAMVGIDLSPKPLSVNADDWVEGSLDDIGAAYNMFLQSRQGQREFVTGYASDVMVQRELSDVELFWIVEQALRTPTHIAAALFASGMFMDCREPARLASDSMPYLTIIAEHWADTAVPFIHKHCPKSETAVLGGHMMFWEHPEQFNRILGDFLADL